MSFTLREPSLPDAPQIAQLHAATWREAYSHLLPENFFSEEHVRSRHQRVQLRWCGADRPRCPKDCRRPHGEIGKISWLVREGSGFHRIPDGDLAGHA